MITSNMSADITIQPTALSCRFGVAIWNKTAIVMNRFCVLEVEAIGEAFLMFPTTAIVVCIAPVKLILIAASLVAVATLDGVVSAHC